MGGQVNLRNHARPQYPANNSLSHDDIQKQCAKPQTQTIAKATGVANQDLF